MACLEVLYNPVFFLQRLLLFLHKPTPVYCPAIINSEGTDCYVFFVNYDFRLTIYSPSRRLSHQLLFVIFTCYQEFVDIIKKIKLACVEIILINNDPFFFWWIIHYIFYFCYSRFPKVFFLSYHPYRRFYCKLMLKQFTYLTWVS
jgi:hypothetical protein